MKQFFIYYHILSHWDENLIYEFKICCNDDKMWFGYYFKFCKMTEKRLYEYIGFFDGVMLDG